MSLCSLIKGIVPKIRMLCFVLINSFILNLLYAFGSYFRTLAVILVADFFDLIFLVVWLSFYVGCTITDWTVFFRLGQ